MILCRRFSTCRHFSLSVSLKLDQVSLINVSSWCCPPLFCLLQVSWPLTFWASRWWERTSVASARSRRRNSVSAGRSWELFIPSLATTTPSTWGWDLNIAAPVSPMSRNSLHCSTNWSYTIFILFKFAASGPDSFQPSGSYSHETGSAAALLSLPSPLHSLPSRTRTRTHCRAADHVWVSNPACFYLDLICFFFWLHWKDLWHIFCMQVPKRYQNLWDRQTVPVGEEFTGDTSVGSWNGLCGRLLPRGSVVWLLHGETYCQHSAPYTHRLQRFKVC